jgi:hypothetical protein
MLVGVSTEGYQVQCFTGRFLIKHIYRPVIIQMRTKLYHTECVQCSAMIYLLFKSYFSLNLEIFYHIKCTPVPFRGACLCLPKKALENMWLKASSYQEHVVLQPFINSNCPYGEQQTNTKC